MAHDDRHQKPSLKRNLFGTNEDAKEAAKKTGKALEEQLKKTQEGFKKFQQTVHDMDETTSPSGSPVKPSAPRPK
jgi:hypothetical protein